MGQKTFLPLHSPFPISHTTVVGTSIAWQMVHDCGANVAKMREDRRELMSPCVFVMPSEALEHPLQAVACYNISSYFFSLHYQLLFASHQDYDFFFCLPHFIYLFIYFY